MQVAGTDNYGDLVANAGTLNLSATGTYTYNPADGFVGTVNDISYTISDGNGGVDSAILSIHVFDNVGNVTYANDDANTSQKGVIMTGNVLTNDTDPEGNTQTVSDATVNGSSITIGTEKIITGVGSLTLNANGLYTFVPVITYVGNLAVIYNICDNGTPQACDEATLYLTSLAVSNPPIAINDVNSTFINTAVSGRVLTNDSNPDSNPITVTAETKATIGGSVTINANGAYTYTPATGFTNEDSFSYLVCDNYGACDSATVTIEVLPQPTPGNDAPVAVNDAYQGIVNVTVTGKVLPNDFDMDDDTITLTTAMYDSNGDGTPDATLAFETATTVWGINTTGQAIAAGTLTQNANGEFNFVPNADFTGQFTYNYTISDSNGKTDEATVTIDIINSNSTYAVDDVYFGLDDAEIKGDLLINDTDPEGNKQTLVTTQVSGPSHGTVVLLGNGKFTYTPNPDYVGTDQFVYEVYDSENPPSRDSATVYINIGNLPPDVTPIITAIPNVMHGTTNFNLFVKITELNLVKTKGFITIKIPKDVRWTFNGAFDQNLTLLGGITLNNSIWTYSEDALNHIFTTTNVLIAGGNSTFGFKAIFSAPNTKGVYTITSQIVSGSGKEIRIDNNVDAEKIDYFIY
jgi:hypothetical protein